MRCASDSRCARARQAKRIRARITSAEACHQGALKCLRWIRAHIPQCMQGRDHKLSLVLNRSQGVQTASQARRLMQRYTNRVHVEDVSQVCEPFSLPISTSATICCERPTQHLQPGLVCARHVPERALNSAQDSMQRPRFPRPTSACRRSSAQWRTQHRARCTIWWTTTPPHGALS